MRKKEVVNTLKFYEERSKQFNEILKKAEKAHGTFTDRQRAEIRVMFDPQNLKRKKEIYLENVRKKEAAEK